MRSIIDIPISKFDEDEFKIGPYIEGLSEFIGECDTPMTIAVQGDWGCGKTSMMQMVKDILVEKDVIIPVWFNTWQFSQFNLDDRLVLTFLSRLEKELRSTVSGEEGKVIAEKVKKTCVSVMAAAAEHFIGGEAAGLIKNGVEVEDKTASDILLELKNSFNDLIQAACKEKNKRVVIFVDDLDRLHPVRSIELLEVLKLFLDCRNCVFVLAIDTSVVFQGIREKYGHDISESKAQSFFDKLIQLPFKMPINYYKLDKMISEKLDFLDPTASEDKQLIKLITNTTSKNPRAIKRLINSYCLIDKVTEKKGMYVGSPEKSRLIRKMILSLSCMQISEESLYNSLLKDYGTLAQDIDFLLARKDVWTRRKANKETREEQIAELEKRGFAFDEPIESEKIWEVISGFITIVADIISHYRKAEGKTEEESLKLLCGIINMNGIDDAM